MVASHSLDTEHSSICKQHHLNSYIALARHVGHSRTRYQATSHASRHCCAGFMLSYKLSAQPGKVTRLLSCTEDNYKRWQDDGIIPTHLAPSWTVHPKTGDVYRSVRYQM